MKEPLGAPSSGDPAVDAVLHTAHRMREAANAELATCGLSLWTFKALKALDVLGPARSVDLGEYLAIAARTVTGAVDALESEGLVERQSHPTDRRAHLIVMTPLGRSRLAEAKAIHQHLVSESVGALSAADQEQLIGLVTALGEAFVRVRGTVSADRASQDAVPTL